MERQRRKVPPLRSRRSPRSPWPAVQAWGATSADPAPSRRSPPTMACRGAPRCCLGLLSSRLCAPLLLAHLAAGRRCDHVRPLPNPDRFLQRAPLVSLHNPCQRHATNGFTTTVHDGEPRSHRARLREPPPPSPPAAPPTPFAAVAGGYPPCSARCWAAPPRLLRLLLEHLMRIDGQDDLHDEQLLLVAPPRSSAVAPFVDVLELPASPLALRALEPRAVAPRWAAVAVGCQSRRRRAPASRRPVGSSRQQSDGSRSAAGPARAEARQAEPLVPRCTCGPAHARIRNTRAARRIRHRCRRRRRHHHHHRRGHCCPPRRS